MRRVGGDVDADLDENVDAVRVSLRREHVDDRTSLKLGQLIDNIVVRKGTEASASVGCRWGEVDGQRLEGGVAGVQGGDLLHHW